MKSKLFRLIYPIIILATIFIMPLLPTMVFADYSLSIGPVYVWTGVLQAGDMLIVAQENITNTTLPGNDVGENFVVRLLTSDQQTELASTIPFAFVNRGFGTGIVSFYFPPASAPAWFANMTIRIEGKITVFSSPPTFNYQIPTSSFSTASTNISRVNDIYTKIMQLTTNLQTAWGSNYTLTTPANTGDVLTSTAESYFAAAIPGLQAMCPALYMVAFGDPVSTSPTWTSGNSTDWEQHTQNTAFGHRMQSAADLFSVSFMAVAAIPVLALCIALVFIGAAQGNVLSGFINAAFVIMPASYYGWFPPIAMIVISFFAGVYVLWHLFGKVFG